MKDRSTSNSFPQDLSSSYSLWSHSNSLKCLVSHISLQAPINTPTSVSQNSWLVTFLCTSNSICRILTSFSHNYTRFFICSMSLILKHSWWVLLPWLNSDWYSPTSLIPSLCRRGSSFIHLIRTDSNVFFVMDELHSIVYMYTSFLFFSQLMDF